MKLKIEKLTKEQTDKLAEYAKKGVEWGLSCEPIDETAARDFGRRIMQWLKRDYLATIIVDSPYAACFAAHMLAIMEAAIAKRIPSKVWAQVWAQVGDQVWDQVRAQVWDQVGAIWPYLDGQWFSYFVAWYRYCKDVLGLSVASIWQIEDQMDFGCVYPLSKFVVVSRRPQCIHRNAAGRLHCDAGPAIRYQDGFSVYALNGVRVPEWLAVKSESEIDPREFAKIENAEVRREFVRKVGIERIATTCGSVCLDKQGDYELLSVNLGGTTGECSYLKMLNPSIGVWHLEAVPPEIDTVAKALSWRNQSDLTPVQLT